MKLYTFYVDIVLARVQVRLGLAVDLAVNGIRLSFYFQISSIFLGRSSCFIRLANFECLLVSRR